MAKSTGDLSLLAKQFSDETAARELLEKLRWPNGAVCPRCGGDQPYKLTPKAAGKNPARQGLYKCRACKRQFSTTTGTIFESSHVPLSKWLMAIHLLAASKKGMSAHQLHRLIGVTYRAAWFMFLPVRTLHEGAGMDRVGQFTSSRLAMAEHTALVIRPRHAVAADQLVFIRFGGALVLALAGALDVVSPAHHRFSCCGEVLDGTVRCLVLGRSHRSRLSIFF